MADFDISAVVGKNRAQTTRRCEITKDVDFADIATGLAAGETAIFMTTPKNFVYEGCDAFLLEAEGATGTLDIGTEADTDGLLDGGNANGTAGTSIAKAGTEAIVAGTFMSSTALVLAIAAAQPTLDSARVRVVVRGYIIEDLS